MMMEHNADPFADETLGATGGSDEGLIHIRIQQRSGRKTLTTVQGIAEKYDKKKIIKHCKKVSLYSSFIWLALYVLLVSKLERLL